MLGHEVFLCIGDQIMYQTQAGDTLYQVVSRFAPDQSQQGLLNYLHEVIGSNLVNLQEVGFSIENPHLTLPLPDMALCLPAPPSPHKKPRDLGAAYIAEASVRYFNRQPYETRYNWHQLQVHGIDLNTFSAASLLSAGIAQLLNHSAVMAGGLVILGEQISDYVMEQARGLVEQMRQIEKIGVQLRNSSVGTRGAIKREFLQAHKTLNENYNHEIRWLKNRITENTRLHSGLTDAHYALVKAKSNKLSFVDSEAFRYAVHAAQYARFLGFGMVGLELGVDVIDTLDAYREGHDWKGTLIEELAGTLGAVFGGLLVGFFFAEPLGWFVIIPATAGGIGGEMFVRELAKYMVGQEN